jgi:hypothetical protein
MQSTQSNNNQDDVLLGTSEIMLAMQSSDVMRDAVSHLLMLMRDCYEARKRRNHARATFTARYEIVVQGSQVSSGYYQHVSVTTRRQNE